MQDIYYWRDELFLWKPVSYQRTVEQVNAGEAAPAALSVSCVSFFMVIMAGASHLISGVMPFFYRALFCSRASL